MKSCNVDRSCTGGANDSSVLGWIDRIVDIVVGSVAAAREYEALVDMSDDELARMGLSRTDISAYIDRNYLLQLGALS